MLSVLGYQKSKLISARTHNSWIKTPELLCFYAAMMKRLILLFMFLVSYILTQNQDDSMNNSELGEQFCILDLNYSHY